MSTTEIVKWIELLEIELRGGLPAGERAWTRSKIAELKARIAATREGA